jgi:hypothetical protein
VIRPHFYNLLCFDSFLVQLTVVHAAIVRVLEVSVAERENRMTFGSTRGYEFSIASSNAWH